MTMTELTPIGEIAAAVPSSVRVFQRHGIDFCCGGKRALGAVCREQGLSFAATVDDIRASERPTADDRDWTMEPLGTLIRTTEDGATHAASIAAPISVLEHEHDQAGALLEELRQLTNGYAPPEWGCATVRALYQGLEALEASMHMHVHLENNVLFPRALR